MADQMGKHWQRASMMLMCCGFVLLSSTSASGTRRQHFSYFSPQNQNLASPSQNAAASGSPREFSYYTTTQRVLGADAPMSWTDTYRCTLASARCICPIFVAQLHCGSRPESCGLRACVCNSDVPCTDSLARVFFLLGVRYCRENYAHQPEPVSASGTDFDFTAAICADRSDCESTYQSVRDRNRLSQAAQSTGTGVHDNCMTLTLDRFLLLLSMCRLACQFFSKELGFPFHCV